MQKTACMHGYKDLYEKSAEKYFLNYVSRAI